MKLANFVLTGAVLSLTNAGPVSKRAISDGTSPEKVIWTLTNTCSSADILNYALTLEHLEATFYEEGLKNYTQADFVKAGLKDPFYANLKEVALDEVEHEKFLTSALKGRSLSPR